MNLFDKLPSTLGVALMAIMCIVLLPCSPTASDDVVDAGPRRSVSACDGSLTRALQAIGSQEATLFIDAPATVDGDTTIPATIGLVFRKGGRSTAVVKVSVIEGAPTA